MDKETTALRPFDRLLNALHAIPPEKQDEIAEAILRQIQNDADLGAGSEDGDQRWARLLADPRSERVLKEMAEQADRNYEAGKSRPVKDLFEAYGHLLDE